jgi:hypothetical protein
MTQAFLNFLHGKMGKEIGSASPAAIPLKIRNGDAIL